MLCHDTNTTVVPIHLATVLPTSFVWVNMCLAHSKTSGGRSVVRFAAGPLLRLRRRAHPHRCCRYCSVATIPCSATQRNATQRNATRHRCVALRYPRPFCCRAFRRCSKYAASHSVPLPASDPAIPLVSKTTSLGTTLRLTSKTPAA